VVRDSQNATIHGLRRYAFGDFLVDAAEGTLTRKGQVVPLTPKAFQTLLVLLEKNGHIVSKEELLQAVWPDSFVEEGNLKFNISTLRKAIGDHGKYIETVPRRGYRFIALVREIGETELQSDISSARPQRQVVFRILLTAGLVAALLIAVPLLSPRRRRSKPSLVSVRRSVAVLGFKNLSGHPQDEWLSRAFAEEITTELAVGGKLRILSEEDVSRMKMELVLPDAETLAKDTLSHVRQNLAVDFVVLGSYADLNETGGAEVRLDLRVQNAATGETVTAIGETGRVSDLFDLVSRAGARLRDSLGIEKITPAEADTARAALPSNMEAVRLYSEGLAALRVFDGVTATDLLERAVASDPEFPPGHSALAEAWATRGYDERAKAEAKRAFDLAARLPREQQILVQARYWEANAEWDKAIDLYRTLFNFFPDNLDYGLKLALAEAQARKGDQAEQTIATLRKLPRPASDDPRIDLAGAAAQESLGDFNRVLAAATHAADKARRSGARLLLARALFYQGWALQNLGHPQEAMAAASQSRDLYSAVGDKYWQARTALTMAEIARMQDDLETALTRTAEAFSVDQQTGNKAAMAWDLNERAIVFLRHGEFQQSKKVHEQSLELFREIDDKRGISVALNNIANVLDEEGDPSVAKTMYEEALGFSHQINNERDSALTMTNIGAELFAMGNLADAKKEQQQALAIAQKVGDKSVVAYALYGLGEADAMESNVSQAREDYEECLNIRNELQEKGNAAETIVAMAKLPSNSAHADDSESKLNQALDEFRAEKMIDDELIATAALARIDLEEGKTLEAQHELDTILPSTRLQGGRASQFEFDLTLAHVQAMRGRLPEARSLLHSVLAEANKRHYEEYRLESELGLAEVAMLSAHPGDGRAQFRSLMQEAAKKNFIVVSHEVVAELRRYQE
jgi:eukaryotic-like serine/threonine-protein kinase